MRAVFYYTVLMLMICVIAYWMWGTHALALPPTNATLALWRVRRRLRDFDIEWTTKGWACLENGRVVFTQCFAVWVLKKQLFFAQYTDSNTVMVRTSDEQQLELSFPAFILGYGGHSSLVSAVAVAHGAPELCRLTEVTHPIDVVTLPTSVDEWLQHPSRRDTWLEEASVSTTPVTSVSTAIVFAVARFQTLAHAVFTKTLQHDNIAAAFGDRWVLVFDVQRATLVLSPVGGGGHVYRGRLQGVTSTMWQVLWCGAFWLLFSPAQRVVHVIYVKEGRSPRVFVHATQIQYTSRKVTRLGYLEQMRTVVAEMEDGAAYDLWTVFPLRGTVLHMVSLLPESTGWGQQLRLMWAEDTHHVRALVIGAAAMSVSSFFSFRQIMSWARGLFS